MKRMIGAISALAALAFSMPGVASANEAMGDVNAGRQIYLNGKGDDVPACAGCHGVDGLGSDDMGTPRLAYQVDTYILKQLVDFASGKRTDNTAFAMNDIAKALTDQDKRNLAAYVHTLKTPFMGSDLEQLQADGNDVGDPDQGMVIAKWGVPERGIPACQSCHSYNGRSAGRMYPAIGGQRYTYLKHELEAFREGATGSREDTARYNDYAAQMRNVAKHLSDEDIANVAAYLTIAKPVTPGNPHAPRRM